MPTLCPKQHPYPDNEWYHEIGKVAKDEFCEPHEDGNDCAGTSSSPVPARRCGVSY
jgi:hypothetical protein